MLLVNLLAALNFVNVFYIKNVWKIKKRKKRDQNKKKRKNVFYVYGIKGEPHRWRSSFEGEKKPVQYWIIHSSGVDRTSCVTRQQSAVYWCLSARFPDHTRQCFLQILPTVAFLFFFRTDSTNSPDCLPILLRMSVFIIFFLSAVLIVGSVRYWVPSVLWRCWLGGRKGIRPVKNWVVGCWRGYVAGARCRLAYGPADATATHCLLLQ